jgi:hypothetical protein
LVTTRILTTRRRLGTSRHPARRRRGAWPLLATVADSPAARRLGVTSFPRVYAAGVALMTLVITYLVMTAQATQTSYDVDGLKRQNTQLHAQQEQLRYQAIRMRTPAGVQTAATAAGMQRSNRAQYAAAQPVAIDLSAPIGPPRPTDEPLWQRALAFLSGGAPRDAQAAGR